MESQALLYFTCGQYPAPPSPSPPHVTLQGESVSTTALRENKAACCAEEQAELRVFLSWASCPAVHPKDKPAPTGQGFIPPQASWGASVQPTGIFHRGFRHLCLGEASQTAHSAHPPFPGPRHLSPVPTSVEELRQELSHFPNLERP